MSRVNIKRLVDNIRSGTNIYTPLIELTVNAIQAIEQKQELGGKVSIQIKRAGTEDMLDRLQGVDGFIVSDNGIGFTELNRDSFDKVYTEQKLADGGKGFGRFTCLKYFDDVLVRSVFSEGSVLKERTFKMGFDEDIIAGESITVVEGRECGAEVELSGIRSVKFPDKGIETIGRVVVERLLPYFVSVDRACPQISIQEAGDPTSKIALNDYLGKKDSQIVEMALTNSEFALGASETRHLFKVRVFKFYSPRTETSRVILTAHRREVTNIALHEYIPEFSEEFLEPGPDGDIQSGRNFVVKVYVFGDYLNDNVSLERGEFRFQADADILSAISQKQIEQKAAEIAMAAVGADIAERKQRKEARIAEYVSTQAPWHRKLSTSTDFSALPMRPSNQEIEIHLQRKKFEQEIATRAQVEAILSDRPTSGLDGKITQIIESISDASKNDLIHYVSMRKCALDLLGKFLESGEDGKYKSEGDVHDLVMPRKKDSDEIEYASHNLWILDERLNFAEFISSEKPINGKRGDRTDITVFNKKIAFRGENEASNPITIFEFKKPQRDDFANRSSKDDPVEQIVRYVNQIRDGVYKTPKGRDILVRESTPFYGYVVCDLSKKVADWLRRDKDFTPMPDGLGWFNWYGNINLYIEVLSWTKLLRDAEMRNKIFFSKLGLD